MAEATNPYNLRTTPSKVRARTNSTRDRLETEAGERTPISSPSNSSRVSSNSPTLSVNERILREVHELYAGENGLCRISKLVNQPILPPRRKIIVLLIGNHSAGKSSYINWYVEEHVQRTGVAIETQGFTFVTSGKKRESLTGNATLHVFPRFLALADIDGVTDYLQTEISTSKQKRFPLVTFIDTPGLVDGDMHYPFDVNKAILWFGNHADLIFVFFDPIGQALCKRTMTLVEKLNEKHADKMRFYLSKADEAGDETDRQRVMMQIVQELCKRQGLNRAGFDMPTIYIPNPARPSRCANQIDSTCKDIEKAINLTIQHSLNALGTDTEKILGIVNRMLEADKEVVRLNKSSTVQRTLIGLFVGLMLALVGVNFLVLMPWLAAFLEELLGHAAAAVLNDNMNPLRKAWSIVPEDYQILSLIGVLTFTFCCAFVLFRSAPTRPRLSRKKRAFLEETGKHLEQHVNLKKKSLYQQYLAESIGEAAV